MAKRDHLDPYWLESVEDFAIHLWQLHDVDRATAYRLDREQLAALHRERHEAIEHAALKRSQSGRKV
jgi:hypothetical protein